MPRPGQLYLPSLPLIYALNRIFIPPSESRRTLKISPVVAIGLRRHEVGRDNGSRAP